MTRLSFIPCLLGLWSTTMALRLDPESAQKENPESGQKDNPLVIAAHRDRAVACKPPAAYRQELINVMDMQYFTQMDIGNQSVTGILDTGSFELVVFSANCSTCGKAGKYIPDKSPTFKAGDSYKVHSYGSGSCKSREGIDAISLGCYNTPNQSLWLAMDCRMPVLSEAGFQSIVGVGPPGQPEYTARETLRQLNDEANRTSKQQGSVPDELQKAIVDVQKELEDALSKKSLLESLNMTTFSSCLGRKPGQPGWMIWNDETREGQDGVMKIHVAGNITWGIAVGGLSMEFTPSTDTDVKEVSEFKMGCEDGCAAIVDTGTSLLAVPTMAYHAIARLLETHMRASDCSDLRNFPTFIIKADGHKLRLPPSSYIGTFSGVPNAQVAKYMHLDTERQRSDAAACQLLLMDMGNQMTTLGPLMILGMPLFREYYTTFDLGSGRGNRSILLSPADEGCAPINMTGKVKYNVNRDAFTPRHVDLSKVRVPEWLDDRSAPTI